jgi:type IX secretion system PorP/SprF family membrane protein
MKRAAIFIMFLMCATGFRAVAQQKIMVSQYMLNQYLVNPAVGGTADFMEAAAGYRAQWVGLEGAPRTFYLTFHLPVGKAPGHYNWKSKKKFHHGLGAYVAVDRTGLLSRTQVYASYAYNMPLSKKFRWSNGLFLGFQQHRIEGDKVRMDGFDASLPGTDINKLFPDLSLGSWLYSKDMYFGLAANQILRNRLEYSVNKVSEEVGRLKYHYYATAGYRFPFYHNELEWIPSIMIRYVHPAPPSFDINNKLKYRKNYWAGVSYRHNDAIALLAGVTLIKSIHIGYSYDLSISKLSPYHANSHEIMLGYSLTRNYDVWSPQMFW